MAHKEGKIIIAATVSGHRANSGDYTRFITLDISMFDSEGVAVELDHPLTVEEVFELAKLENFDVEFLEIKAEPDPEVLYEEAQMDTVLSILETKRPWIVQFVDLNLVTQQFDEVMGTNIHHEFYENSAIGRVTGPNDMLQFKGQFSKPVRLSIHNHVEALLRLMELNLGISGQYRKEHINMFFAVTLMTARAVQIGWIENTADETYFSLGMQMQNALLAWYRCVADGYQNVSAEHRVLQKYVTSDHSTDDIVNHFGNIAAMDNAIWQHPQLHIVRNKWLRLGFSVADVLYLDPHNLLTAGGVGKVTASLTYLRLYDWVSEQGYDPKTFPLFQ